MNVQAGPMRRWQWGAAAALSVFGVWSQSYPVVAQSAARLDRGRTFVEKNCAGCHSVTSTGSSKHPSAPPFRTLGRKYPIEHLAEALAEGIVVGHSAMPVFRLAPEEIADVLDYVASLQKPPVRK